MSFRPWTIRMSTGDFTITPQREGFALLTVRDTTGDPDRRGTTSIHVPVSDLLDAVTSTYRECNDIQERDDERARRGEL
jgi:hypothetical protein